MCLDRPCGAGVPGGGVLPCGAGVPVGGVLPGGVVGGGGVWWWWCLVSRPHIASGNPGRGSTILPSAAALASPNRSCRVETTNKISLIINYL